MVLQIVKAILRTEVEAAYIYKDTESYWYFIRNNIRKWICRIYINTKAKYVIIWMKIKKE